MNFDRRLLATMLVTGLLGCAAESSGPIGFADMSHDDHLRCAAQIGAFNGLMSSGRIEREGALFTRMNLAMMTHLNSYAIPQKLAEPEAFAAMNGLRDALLTTSPPEELRAAALACLDAADKSGVY